MRITTFVRNKTTGENKMFVITFMTRATTREQWHAARKARYEAKARIRNLPSRNSIAWHPCDAMTERHLMDELRLVERMVGEVVNHDAHGFGAMLNGWARRRELLTRKKENRAYILRKAAWLWLPAPVTAEDWKRLARRFGDGDTWNPLPLAI